MDFKTAICWAFDTVPSRLIYLFEEYSLNDLRTKVGIAGEYEVVKHTQIYESLAIIASAVAGGKKDNKGKVTDVSDSNSAVRAFNEVF
jgi:hypothetical protein